MLLSGRPLLDTRNDARVFVNRSIEVERILESLVRRWNVIVSGERGVGKTSLVRHVMYQAAQGPNSELAFTFVRGGDVTSAAELLGRVCDGLSGDAPGGRASKTVEENLDSLRMLVTEHGVHGHHLSVIVLDDPPAVIANQLFGPLRDDLWDFASSVAGHDPGHRLPAADHPAC